MPVKHDNLESPDFAQAATFGQPFTSDDTITVIDTRLARPQQNQPIRPNNRVSISLAARTSVR